MLTSHTDIPYIYNTKGLEKKINASNIKLNIYCEA